MQFFSPSRQTTSLLDPNILLRTTRDNGSKTAAMEVIGSLCVSLGSSTVQLRDSLCSRRACTCSEAGFSSQNGDRVWGMYYRRALFFCAFFLWAKGLNAKDIHKDMFPVYGGKCLSRKAVHKRYVEIRGERFVDFEEVEMEVRKWLRQQSKHFYAAGCDALVIRWDKCIKVGGGFVKKYMFFPGSSITCFCVLYPLVTYLLTSSYVLNDS
jgi:hypothetical protein